MKKEKTTTTTKTKAKKNDILPPDFSMTDKEYKERLDYLISNLYVNPRLKVFLMKFRGDSQELFQEVIFNLYNREKEKMYKYIQDENSFDKLTFQMCKYMSYGTIGKSNAYYDRKMNGLINKDDDIYNISNENEIISEEYDVNEDIYSNMDIIFEVIESYLRTIPWNKSMIYRDYMYKINNQKHYMKRISEEYKISRSSVSNIINDINNKLILLIKERITDENIILPKSLNYKVKYILDKEIKNKK